MYNSPLKSYAASLYLELAEELQLMFGGGIESADLFAKAVFKVDSAIEKIYGLVPVGGFLTGQDEIIFFKFIKPVFVSEKEYYQRRYHASLFATELWNFCEKELVRMEKLLVDHAEFSTYYHNQETYNDYSWFSQGQAPLPTTLLMQPWETNPLYTSARDGWVSGLLAVERYTAWLKTKIVACK